MQVTRLIMPAVKSRRFRPHLYLIVYKPLLKFASRPFVYIKLTVNVDKL